MASSAPLLGLFSTIFKHAYWYIQISGERLQDHWSSGSFFIQIIEAVLTCTHSQCFEQNCQKYQMIFFSGEFSIFTGEKKLRILDGKVFVMCFTMVGFSL